MKRQSQILIFILILLVIILTGFFVYSFLKIPLTQQTAQQNNSQLLNQENINVGLLISTIKKIYSNSDFSNGKQTKCLDLYIESARENKDFNIVSSCPTLVKGVDFSNISYKKNGVEELIGLSEVADNPEPVIKYLLKNRQNTSNEYKLVYEKFIASQYLKNQNSSEDTFLKEMILDGFYENPISVDTLTVSPNMDLAILTDIPSSGAYNMFNTLYRVVFSQDNIIINPFDMIINTMESGFALNEVNKEVDELVNATFDHEKNTFNVYGMLPFGSYPCNINYEYKFFNDRLILVSENQAKDCNKYVIDGPGDIPDNFDGTQEQIYEVSPDILEKAKQAKF